MKCRKYHHLILGALYGELSAGKQRKLNAHLHRCRACRTEFESLQKTLGIIRKQPFAPHPSRELDDSILERAGTHAPGVSKRFFLFRPFPAAFAAALFAVIFISLLHRGHQTPETFLKRQARSAIVHSAETENKAESSATSQTADESRDFDKFPSVNTREKAEGKTSQRLGNLSGNAPSTGEISKRKTHRAKRIPAPRKEDRDAFSSGDFEEMEDLDEVVLQPDSAYSRMQSFGSAASVIQPKVIRKFYPECPETTGLQKGMVVIRVTVTHDGKIKPEKILRSMSKECDAVALKAVRKWKIQPGTRNGTPVDMQINLTVVFKGKTSDAN